MTSNTGVVVIGLGVGVIYLVVGRVGLYDVCFGLVGNTVEVVETITGGSAN